MSWYVGLDGKKVWADRDETVITVGEAPSEEELPLENLAYLTSASSKAVYAEHMVDDDLGDKKNKKAKEKQSGRQRGFVVRLDSDARTRVVAPLQAAADRLIESGTVSRIDLDESAAPGGKRKNKDKDKDKEKMEEIMPPLGANECRVETKARVQHFAHGRGFQVDVLESGSRQRIHMFTAEELPAAEWHRRLVAAVEFSGGRMAIGRMAGEDGPPGSAGGRGSAKGVVQAPPPRKDEAREEEDDWLDSVLGRCMVPKGSKTAGQGADQAAAGDENGKAGAEGAPAPAEKPKAKSTLPPWLRR